MSASAIQWLLLVGITGVILAWASTWWLNHSLLKMFVKRYPQVASEKIPYANAPVAHPQKCFYFLSLDFRKIAKSDSALERLRRWFLAFLIASIALPPLLFGILCMIAIHQM